MRKVYLLSVEELHSPGVYEKAVELLDSERKKRAARCRETRDRVRSVGAGLLLQLAYAQVWEQRDCFAGGVNPRHQAGPGGELIVRDQAAASARLFPWQQVSVSEILSRVGRGRELLYVTGKDGKPYLADSAFYFSLSHSGEFVICAVSDCETGADIQEKKEADYRKLVGRFFTEGEKKIFASCSCGQEEKDLFYLLWTRKEAWGKLTGKGLMEGLDRMQVLEAASKAVVFEDYSGLPGYQASVCFRKENPV